MLKKIRSKLFKRRLVLDDDLRRRMIEREEADKAKAAEKTAAVLKKINDRVTERMLGKGLSEDKRFIWLPELGKITPHKPEYCYMDMFEDEVEKHSLVSIENLRFMSTRSNLTNERFMVTVATRGFLHLELVLDSIDEEDSWTVFDILSLPESIYISGQSFRDQMWEEGFSEQACNSLSYYFADNLTSSKSSTTTDSTTSNFYKVVDHCLDNPMLKPQEVFRNLFLLMRENQQFNLSRVQMEVVARLCDQFCYSAYVADPKTFMEDVINDSGSGDTEETIRRFYLAEDTKVRKDGKEANKKLYMTKRHISRFKFDKSTEITTGAVVGCLGLVLNYKDTKAPEAMKAMLDKKKEKDKYKILIEDLMNISWMGT